VQRGHQVTALVGLPNYPTGVIPDEYKHFRNRRQFRNGVEIRRCFEIGRRPSKIGLAVNYISYMVSASLKALLLKRDYDVIYSFSTSPVLMSFPAALLRCFTKKKFMIYVLDIWPACLSAMNVYEGSPLYTLMKPISRWVYSKADVLIYSSKLFQPYLKEVHQINVPDEWYMPQFADDVFQQKLPAKSASDRFHLVFAGNIGKLQGVETFIQAADILRNEPIQWHFVGDGSNYEQCVSLAHSLSLDDKVIFYGRKPLEAMPEYYAMADAMLVSMKDDCTFNFTLPGKVQSYMAAGKPILGSIGGETVYVLNKAKCGLCAPPEDPQAFAKIVRTFIAMSNREQLGKNGQEYYNLHFTKKSHMDRLETMIKEMAGES